MRTTTAFILTSVIFILAGCGTDSDIQTHNARVSVDAGPPVEVATVINMHLNSDFVPAPFDESIQVQTGDELGVTVLYPGNSEVVPTVTVDGQTLDYDIGFEYEAIGYDEFISKRYLFDIP